MFALLIPHDRYFCWLYKNGYTDFNKIWYVFSGHPYVSNAVEILLIYQSVLDLLRPKYYVCIIMRLCVFLLHLCKLCKNGLTGSFKYLSTLNRYLGVSNGGKGMLIELPKIDICVLKLLPNSFSSIWNTKVHFAAFSWIIKKRLDRHWCKYYYLYATFIRIKFLQNISNPSTLSWVIKIQTYKSSKFLYIEK